MMDWKSDSTAESLVMLRPRTWLLFMRLTKVLTAFCSAFRNCAWLSSASPFWYCCWGHAVALAERRPRPQAPKWQPALLGRVALPEASAASQAPAPEVPGH